MANERIAMLLVQCEVAMGDAFAATGELASALIAARRAAGLPEGSGSLITRRVASVMGAITQGQKEIDGVHRQLAQLCKRMGTDPMLYGDSQHSADDAVFGGI